MENLTVIIPLHKFDDEVRKECEQSFKALKETIETYSHGTVETMVVAPKSVISDEGFNGFVKECGIDVKAVENDGETDFCSQVNKAVDEVKTDHFTIMEYDDEYTPKWFNMAHDCFKGNEDKSVMLPVNAYHDSKGGNWQYGNTMALSPAFITDNADDTDPLGVINKYRISGVSAFNLTGAIFRTQDFISAGKYKPSIQIAFNYELLLRMTNKGMKAIVAPKEGYIHVIGRPGSLTDTYMREYSDEDIRKWHELAERESRHDEDRGLGIDSVSKEEIK